MQFHFPLFDIWVVLVQFFVDDGVEVSQLIVASDDLYAVVGEEHRVAAGNIDASSATQDAAHMNAETSSHLQFAQCLPNPCGVIGHINFRNVHVAVEQVSFIKRFFLAEHLCFDIP